MEDKTYQAAIEARTQSLSEELTRYVTETMKRYTEGLGTPNAQTLAQITSSIENKPIRTMVQKICMHIYLTILVKTNHDFGITNQDQTNELNAYLNEVEHLMRRANAKEPMD